jgi:hypothetical protein
LMDIATSSEPAAAVYMQQACLCAFDCFAGRTRVYTYAVNAACGLQYGKQDVEVCNVCIFCLCAPSNDLLISTCLTNSAMQDATSKPVVCITSQ